MTSYILPHEARALRALLRAEFNQVTEQRTSDHALATMPLAESLALFQLLQRLERGAD